MVPKCLNKLKRYVANFLGWRTSRKIIVFESDDWGSIRMPSRESFEKLEKAGLNLRDWDAERYNLNDSLATAEDLEKLFEVITSVKDKSGNYAVFTPVTIVANPDFQKIKDSDFNEYYYEPFTETLKRYPGCELSFELWKEGIEKHLFVPQMHGREHLNVKAWMNALKSKDNQAHLAFNEGVWGFVPENYPKVDYQAAFLPGSPSEIEYHKEILKDGMGLFKKLFGYQAEYFVPPNGCFNNYLNQTLSENGIKFRSAPKIQFEPLGNGKFRRVFHWLGQKEKTGIRYITRNCFFEPSKPGKDWVDSCLYDIQIAFKYRKPAVISTHRVNYVGSLNKSNRDTGLYQLKQLLQKITKNWPEVEFMTTPQLGRLIEGSD